MTISDFISISAAVFAILMTGSGQPRHNLLLYSIQTCFIAFACIEHSLVTGEHDLYFLAIAIIAVKALTVPFFLASLAKKIDAHTDPGTFIPIPLCMHVAIVLMGLSHYLARTLPPPQSGHLAVGGATAAVSLLLTGTLFMLTRRIALSQIIGFLTMENGIFLFALTQTKGMPFIVEMGVLLDVLVAVMIGGLFVFRIKKSFEHIDVTRMNGLKEP